MGATASIESQKYDSCGTPTRRPSPQQQLKPSPARRRLSLSSLQQFSKKLIPSKASSPNPSYFLSESYFLQLSALLSKNRIYEEASRGELKLDPRNETYPGQALALERQALLEAMESKLAPGFTHYNSREKLDLCDAYFRSRHERYTMSKLQLARLLRVKLTNRDAYAHMDAWKDIELVRYNHLQLDTPALIQKEIITKGLTSLGQWDEERLEERSVVEETPTEAILRRRSSLFSTISLKPSARKQSKSHLADDTESVASDTLSTISAVSTATARSSRSTRSAISTSSTHSHPSVILKQKKKARRASSSIRAKKINLNKSLGSPSRPHTRPHAARGTNVSSPAKSIHPPPITRPPLAKREPAGHDKTEHTTKSNNLGRPETTPTGTRRTSHITTVPLSVALSSSDMESETSTSSSVSVLKPKRRLSRKENSHITYYTDSAPKKRSSIGAIANKVDNTTSHARKRLSDVVKHDPLLLREHMKKFQSTGNLLVQKLSPSSQSVDAASSWSEPFAPLSLQQENLRHERLSKIFDAIGYYKPVLLFVMPFHSPYFRMSVTKLNHLYQSFSPQLGFVYVFTFEEMQPNTNTPASLYMGARDQPLDRIERRCEAVHSCIHEQRLTLDMVFVDDMQNQFRDTDTLVDFPFGVYLVQNSNMLHVESDLVQGIPGESVDFISLESHLRGQGYGKD